ncbi:MAG: caspase family protein [Deltaproteobacteria bacterium]|nr:caspase family protein [Deltaproteobacteria bacterium]
MKHKLFCIVIVSSLLWTQSVAYAFSGLRYAVIIGNNNGPESDPPLKYAENDAKNIYDALKELGNFSEENSTLLLGKDIETIRQTLDKTKNSIRNLKRSDPKTKVDFLVYYSGHSNSQGLQINNQILPITELKQLVRSSGADIKMGIVDGCNSGTLVAAKGANKAQSFEIDLQDTSDVHGEIFISSSTSLERSFESSELRGSFFTYFFVTGLRGDADYNNDGSVSLAEGYRYAYDHTVLKTASLNLGEQHPTSQVALRGKGEVMLTELSQKISYLFFPDNDNGKYFIYNSKGGYIVSELEKKAGVTKRLALGQGPYIIRKLVDGKLIQKEFQIPRTGNQVLNWDNAKVLSEKKTTPLSSNVRTLSYQLPVENFSRKERKILKSGPQKVLLNRGELIRLRLLENLNSKTVHYGDKIQFETVEDILVNEKLVIPAGSLAIGDIIYNKPRVGLARGEMALTVRYVKAIDGQNIPLSTVVGRQGKGKDTDANFAEYSQHYRNMDHHFFEDSFRYNQNPYKDEKLTPNEMMSRIVSLGLAMGISAAVWGTNAKMKKGTIISAFVDQDREIIVP